VDGNGEHKGNAETNKSTGCYEIQHLPSGTYLVSLKDDRFGFQHIGATQAEVHISSQDPDKVDLTTELPAARLLGTGIARALTSARFGFSSEKETGLPMNSYLGDFGSGLPAKILSGFEKCVIHYQSGTGGATAAEWCELNYVRKEDEAIALFGRMADSIRSAVRGAQAFRYDELKGSEGGCVDCTRQADWLSQPNGAISLRLLRSHSTYSIQLWLIYSQRIAAEICAASAKGALAQTDPRLYQAELAQVASEVEGANRRELHREERNLFRALVVGGTMETAPTPVALTEFPATDISTSCVIAAGKSAAMTTVPKSAAPRRSAEQPSAPRSLATIPDGALVRLSLGESLNSATNRVGDAIHLRVIENVRVGSLIMIPTGSPAVGHVLKDERKKRLGRGGKLDFMIDDIMLADNTRVKVRANSAREGKGKTGKLVTFSVLVSPLSPLILMKHGKDVAVPKDTTIIAYVDGDQKVAPPVSALSDESQPQGIDAALVPASAPGAFAPGDSVSSADLGNAAPSVLNLKSEPVGADITVDGEFVGNTPTTTKVPVGHHSVVLSKNGFKNWERTLTVSSGGNITVDAALEKKE